MPPLLDLEVDGLIEPNNRHDVGPNEANIGLTEIRPSRRIGCACKVNKVIKLTVVRSRQPAVPHRDSEFLVCCRSGGDSTLTELETDEHKRRYHSKEGHGFSDFSDGGSRHGRSGVGPNQ